MMKLFVGTLFMATLAVACGASAPVPDAQRTKTASAIHAAEAVGAPGVPKAALHLKMAQDQAATAERLIRDDENEDAALVLMRAQADADLALELARETQMRKEAAEARAKIEELKKQAGIQ